MKAKCPFCEWTLKTNGIYQARRVTREHVKNEHPLAFKQLELKEASIGQDIANIRYVFGLATNHHY